MEKPIIINALETEGCCVPKGWGDEIIIENNEMYCGKLLRFKQGAKFSMHYHMIKDETWYVDKGEFIYRWIDTETAETNEQYLKIGDTVRQRPGQPHQLVALTMVLYLKCQHITKIQTHIEFGKEIHKNENNSNR